MRYLPISIFLIAAALAVPSAASAAAFAFGTSTVAVPAGVAFRVTVSLDTEGAVVNAFQGTLTFPAASLEVVAVGDGNSVVPLWVERPQVPPPCAEACALRWSGVIPGGFDGVRSFERPGPGPGQLFEVTFRAKREGEALIRLAPGSVFLNDGAGTERAARGAVLRVTVTATGAGEDTAAPADAMSPERFTPQLVSDPALFDGAWALVWGTQDKQSGIAFYEVGESRVRLMRPGWVGERTESPYRLRDQELRSYVYVRAVDQVGNETVAELAPAHPLPWYENPWFWGILIAFILIFGWWAIGRKRAT